MALEECMHVWCVKLTRVHVFIFSSCVNSRERRAARRKSHDDRSNDYVTMSELGDSPKKEDLTLSLGGELGKA